MHFAILSDDFDLMPLFVADPLREYLNSKNSHVNWDTIVVHPGRYTGVGNSGIFVVRIFNGIAIPPLFLSSSTLKCLVFLTLMGVGQGAHHI